MGANQEKLPLVKKFLQLMSRVRSQKLEQSAEQARRKFLNGNEPFDYWETGTGRLKFPSESVNNM